MKTATIIGSGFTGCMFAMLLKQKNWNVTVIERSSLTGGGIRTFYHGGHPFTYGPRHFLSPFKEAYDFMNNIIPMRDIKKMNYSFNEKDQCFYNYPIHADDLPRMPEFEQIKRELSDRPPEAQCKNFEEFWISRVGPTLYEKFVKHYNAKAWQVNDNKVVDHGFEVTVKAYPIQEGDRYEFRNWYNCYPIAPEGYNKFFDVALEGCKVMLNKEVTGYDLAQRTVVVDGEKIKSDILISTTSPDIIMDNHFGELAYVGREFYKMVLPIEQALPEDVYFLYYPNKSEDQTRVVEYKKFSLHKSPSTLLVMEVPSMKNKLYPTLMKREVDRANQYFKALPQDVYSVGRMGAYKYVDMDDIIMEAFAFMKKLES